MNNLVKVFQEDVFTDSLVIAEGTRNEHESVVTMLKKYWNDFEACGHIEFTDLKSGKRGRPTRVYQLNEEQAILLMTYLDNTQVVRDFKKKLVHQFYTMRQILLQRQTPVWQNTRCLSKQIRKKEEDRIKEFIDYAISQGSTHAERYYTSFSKLADKAAGIKEGCRDIANLEQLNKLTIIEQIIQVCIQEGLQRKIDYKEIYQNCKERVNQLDQLLCVA